MTRRLMGTALVAVTYAAATLAVFYWAFAAGMKGSWDEGLAGTAFTVIIFPILFLVMTYLKPDTYDSSVMIIGWLMNSCLWGIVIWYFIDRLWRRRLRTSIADRGSADRDMESHP